MVTAAAAAALAVAGALVFVDEMVAPMAFPLVDGVHVVYYDPMDRDAFRAKLRHYLDRPVEARRIGFAGHAYALQHHRTVRLAPAPPVFLSF